MWVFTEEGIVAWDCIRFSGWMELAGRVEKWGLWGEGAERSDQQRSGQLGPLLQSRLEVRRWGYYRRAQQTARRTAGVRWCLRKQREGVNLWGQRSGGVTLKLQLWPCDRPGTADHAQQRSEMGQHCRCHLRTALSWGFFASRILTTGCSAIEIMGKEQFQRWREMAMTFCLRSERSGASCPSPRWCWMCWGLQG